VQQANKKIDAKF